VKRPFRGRLSWPVIGIGMAACVLAAPAAVRVQASTSAATSAAPTSCTSNGEPEVFSGGTPGAPLDLIPPAGTPITPGTTIGVKFTDETPLDTTNLPPVFLVDGSQVTPTLTPPSGNVVNITFTLPSTMSVGTHTASVDAWDTDQTEGGDCGHVTFSFTVSAATQTTTTTPTPTPSPTGGAAGLIATPNTGEGANLPAGAGLLLGGTLLLGLGIAWRAMRRLDG
jgi:hypothetical protein